MKATLKSLVAVSLFAATTLVTGCASLSLEGDGNSRPNDFVSQLEDGSRGK